MAGDKQFTHSSGLMITGKTKIYEVPEQTAIDVFNTKRAFIGFCGNADSFGDVINWLWYPEEKAPRCKGIEMILLNANGQIFHGTNMRNWMLINQPFFSVGSGMQYAMGAMSVGKTPYEAVKIASKHDANTGKGFNKLEMK